MKPIAQDILNVKGQEIHIYTTNFQDEFISLTDIAKYRSDEPNDAIKNWLRNRETIEFLGLWEKLHNPTFKPVEFDGFKNQAGLHSFTLSPKKWIEGVNAIGIMVKSGRYGGGTYAHPDIAFEFASWISAEFKLYIIQDYKRLKASESNKLSQDWNLKRTLSKLNYRLQTDAIQNNILPQLTQKQTNFAYATEADLLNVALFGETAKEWRTKHPKKTGNIRDNASVPQLIVLANLESYNSILIKEGKNKAERLILLRQVAESQLSVLLQKPNQSPSNLLDGNY